MDKKIETFNQYENTENADNQVENKERQQGHKGKKLLIASAIALTLTLAACKTPTSEDIFKQQQQIEMVSKQIAIKIEDRKTTVRTYNALLERSQNETNPALERSKAQVFKLIKDYNKEIERLGNKYIRATKRLDDITVRSQNINMNPREPIDENAYDYLLTMTQ